MWAFATLSADPELAPQVAAEPGLVELLLARGKAGPEVALQATWALANLLLFPAALQTAVELQLRPSPPPPPSPPKEQTKPQRRHSSSKCVLSLHPGEKYELPSPGVDFPAAPLTTAPPTTPLVITPLAALLPLLTEGRQSALQQQAVVAVVVVLVVSTTKSRYNARQPLLASQLS